MVKFLRAMNEKEQTMQERTPVDPLIRDALEDGEELVWWERPDAENSAGYRTLLKYARLFWFFVLLAAVWMVLSFLSIFRDKLASDPLSGFFLILVALCIFVALKLLHGPYMASFRKVRAIKMSLYAITKRRIMTISTGAERKVVAYGLDEIESIGCVETSEGWGDLVFKVGGQKPGVKGRAPVHFAGIAAVRTVEKLLREAMKECL